MWGLLFLIIFIIPEETLESILGLFWVAVKGF